MAYPPMLCACLDDALTPPPVVIPAPVPVSAIQIAADVIRVTFSGSLTATPQVDPGAFSIALVGPGPHHVVTASLNGDQVNLVLNGPHTFTSGTVTYAPTGTGDLLSAADGTPVAGFTTPATPMARETSIVNNGTFDDETGWTFSGGAQWAAGALGFDGSGTGTAVATANTTITAGTYQYEFDVLSTDGNDNINIIIGGTSSGAIVGSNAPGHFSGTITTAATDQVVRVRLADSIAQIDNLVITKV